MSKILLIIIQKPFIVIVAEMANTHKPRAQCPGPGHRPRGTGREERTGGGKGRDGIRNTLRHK